MGLQNVALAGRRVQPRGPVAVDWRTPQRAPVADDPPKPFEIPIAVIPDDIDEVRSYLGYGQINLWGGSYGTRAALVYLRQHEANVRSVIIDGVAPPDMKLPLYMARDSQRSLDLLLAGCEKDPACAAKFPG